MKKVIISFIIIFCISVGVGYYFSTSKNKEKSEKYLKILKDEIERSLAIMADFKELNKITLTKDLVDINLLVEEVYNSLNLLTSSKNINIEFINKEEIYVNIDYNKIKQVLINIIKNSIEAIENNGIIKIETHTNKKSRSRKNIYSFSKGICKRRRGYYKYANW